MTKFSHSNISSPILAKDLVHEWSIISHNRIDCMYVQKIPIDDGWIVCASVPSTQGALENSFAVPGRCLRPVITRDYLLRR